jgi:transcriptional regulator with XRE-family HTH domain
VSTDLHGDVATGVGAVVRRRRLTAELSMTSLAEQSGLTQPFLSQVEHGKAVPSLVTLYRIAAALGVAPQDLLADVDPASGDVRSVAAGQGPHYPMTEEDAASSARLLMARPGVEVIEYELAPGFREEEWFSHAGTDLLYVVRGRVVVELADGREERAGAGGAVQYPGTVAHRWRAGGRGAVKLVLVGLAGT